MELKKITVSDAIDVLKWNCIQSNIEIRRLTEQRDELSQGFTHAKNILCGMGHDIQWIDTILERCRDEYANL